ncbi:MAG: arginine decarboxylase, pyruvoyl-dependent [Deltaproteobacteria bacterium]|nr:arginine decarboxylase, pyruvoyl-dependent [Deltaproteobacteria bacterium]
MSLVPTKCFLTNGVGKHKEKLQSFEMALRDAGIAHFNLVRVSSIFPPNCRIIPRKEGLKLLKPGQIVFCVLYDTATDEAHRMIAASVGLAIPRDRSHHGYLSEHKAYGQTDSQAGDYAEDLAAEMLATVLGVGFDKDKSWNERRKTWTISGDIVKTMNITQSAVGDKTGLWTSVCAGAIFIP